MKKISLIISILVIFLLSGCDIDMKQCTKEGKLCEDGTVLSRGGINCEFPECSESDIIKEIIEDEKILEQEHEPEPEQESTVKEFEIIAKKWDFEPAMITVNEGDTVRLHITSIDVTHGFVLPTFGINENLASGDDVYVEFIADQKGEFTYQCSVYCGSGHSHMKGTLIIE